MVDTKKPLAVSLISGGLDSVALAYYLAHQGFDLTLLSVDYGQRHKHELTFAKKAAEALNARWHIVDLTSVTRLLTGSSLTDNSVETPDGLYNEESMKLTVVPNRNMMMLSIAWAVAVASNADTVATAVHAGDHYIYPDCRPEFTEAFEYTAKKGNEGFGNPALRLFTPFIGIGKHDIVSCGANLPEPYKVPFISSWSCYKGGEDGLAHMVTGEPIHCGRCGTCTERKEAFRLAAVPDPTVYSDPEFKIVAYRG